MSISGLHKIEKKENKKDGCDSTVLIYLITVHCDYRI